MQVSTLKTVQYRDSNIEFKDDEDKKIKCSGQYKTHENQDIKFKVCISLDSCQNS